MDLRWFIIIMDYLYEQQSYSFRNVLHDSGQSSLMLLWKQHLNGENNGLKYVQGMNLGFNIKKFWNLEIDHWGTI